MDIVLLYMLHVISWFCFGALCGMIRGYGAMKVLSAMALSIFSVSGQLIARYLGYLP